MKALLFFLACIVCLDQLLGRGLNTIYRRTTSGELGGLINLALKQTPDILVLGSSRAQHHVVPSVLHERLSATVFNAGVNGQDFLYAVMLLDLWTRAHPPPAAIILNIDPRSLARSEEELQRASVFSAYFDDSPIVRQILLMRGRYANLKYLSYSYRFNGKALPILKNSLMRPDPSFDGYLPLAGSLDVEKGGPAPVLGAEGEDVDWLSYWDVKLEYLRALANYCHRNRTRLFLVVGPVFHSEPEMKVWSARLSRFPAWYPGLEFLDLSERKYPELFAGQRQLYKDNLHLNTRGAVVFSTLLGNRIARQGT